MDSPIVAYTANGNLEAHSVVAWLGSNGIHAYAVEDNSGVSLFAFGTISQFHKSSSINLTSNEPANYFGNSKSSEMNAAKN